MPEVLLSDIDGTLVDSNALHAEAWRRTFEHFGIQIGLDEAWRQIGKGGDHVYRDICFIRGGGYWPLIGPTVGPVNLET